MNNCNYLIRRKVLSFLGAKFHIFDNAGNPVGFCRQKAFKLKEDIRVYSDESQCQELLTILARNIIDFSACYDVFDPASGMLLGSWVRKGWSSIVRDNWVLLDPAGNRIAELKEDDLALAVIRRFLCTLIPQSYTLHGYYGLQAEYKQCFNPFVFKLKVGITPGCSIHPYLILAGGILLAAIEGRQN